MNGPVAIDANLLVLLIVGSTARRYISLHKRLKAYSEDDFDLLIDLIGCFSSIIFLPNTLTEASNLSRQIGEPAKSEIALKMRLLVDAAEEQYIPSKDVVRHQRFVELGLTDAALLDLSSRTVDGLAPTLLTTDLDLAVAAEIKGYLVENFNHYRDIN